MENVLDRSCRAQQKILYPLNFLYKSLACKIIKHKGVNVLKLFCCLYISVSSVATSPYGQDSISSTDTNYVCVPVDVVLRILHFWLIFYVYVITTHVFFGPHAASLIGLLLIKLYHFHIAVKIT